MLTAQNGVGWSVWVQAAGVLLGIVLSLVALGSVAYLWTLLGAALRAGRRTSSQPEQPRLDPTALGRVAVVIPAHNEELVLGATLGSLQEQTYPPHLLSVVVVADNCTDRTAAIAQEHAATVLERTDLVRRGKGYALEWAFAILLGPDSPLEEGERAPVAAFVIVDADTDVVPDFVAVMAQRLVSDPAVPALQGRYGVLNPQEGWRAALMTAAFDLFNHVKLLGAHRLGWSVGLKGNGMAFTRSLLERARWRGDSITEDIDFGLDLLSLHGVRVGYVPQAQVLAQMPVSGTQAASQRERWERGRYRLLRERALPLLALGLRRRSKALCAASADLAVPPLSELMGLLVLWGALVGADAVYHFLPGGFATAQRYALAAGCVGFVSYVLIGLHAAGARREAYLALLRAPIYIVWKFVLYAARPLRALTTGRTARPGDGAAGEEWVRTARTAREK